MILGIISAIIILYDIILFTSIQTLPLSFITTIITVVLNILLIIIILFKTINYLLYSQFKKSELDEVIEFFDKSNDISIINDRIDDYINDNYSKCKLYLIYTIIIKKLVDKKNNELKLLLKQKLSYNDSIITKEIIKKELEKMDTDLTIYTRNLIQKSKSILELDRINNTIIEINSI